ncbi:DUF2268 domain-containing putative Zn-dependent protease [Chitinophaga sp. GCM10012297]|uniref:DUF2268 domain-containing protein n=1 Tax=Chitinophaga chungangae TaxID=2821488 RepID=A0ABS3Y932_9BACT|nr:DUF2268 domain-containing putative Zn-dependent protease [Chitinophaga chungangae]MBO9151198.1 hypothetical protein [Chitinophaga chungangae]
MIKYYLALVTGVLLTQSAKAQAPYPSDPDSAVFITKDINNFWKAFDLFKQDTTTNPFGSAYIDIGSAGVKGFIPNRIKSAEHLLEVVKKREKDYGKVRDITMQMTTKEKQCRSTFYALKYWYPEARFPPVYFVIGAFNSGGTAGETGVYIGAEKQADAEGVPYVVAHELIHFQQKNWPENPTLLQQSIMEGVADFLGELISGRAGDDKAMAYGDQHEERLCEEFVRRMDGTDYQDWLYGVSGKDDRPNDLGYWMGYKITRQYFRNSPDKKQAVREMLNIKDHKDFLDKSGYLKKYMRAGK